VTKPAPVFYLIPGLGADERVFQFLQLQGEVHVLPWLVLRTPDETLPQYAARLAAAVPEAQPCWLVGVSFGGLLALEVGRLRPLARLVLISSLGSAAELPVCCGWHGLRASTAWCRRSCCSRVPRLAQWFFGANNGEEYQLLRRILQDTDPEFARWAIAHLLEWDSHGVRPAVRLHGTHDRLLPAGAGPVAHRIAGGGHFMIVSHAAEISAILNQLADEQETQAN
jgi:pimeloyl-ACP methyl ester carboxylesterase